MMRLIFRLGALLRARAKRTANDTGPTLDDAARAIAALPETTREVFMLHRFDGLDYAAIAERLGLSVEQVERHISTALVQLHRALIRNF